MSDLIDRQAAIDALDAYIKVNRAPMHYENQFWVEGMEDAERIIKELPSAQPAIVRCKDCKYYEIWQLKADYTGDKRYKPSVCTIGTYSVFRTPDWFCADGERRADDEN